MHGRQTLALIAHDGRKADMVAFATYNRARLAEFDLVATSTTGRLLHDKVGLNVRMMLSGPLGGDAQIAALVAEGRIRAVFFFSDPLSAHPHDPDIRTLLRVCNVHNVPIATNVAAGDLFLASPILEAGSTVDEPGPEASGARVG
ncbi:MAG TPA: methylglyoxal synthase [Candidatus Limnocylindrales bacterium]